MKRLLLILVALLLALCSCDVSMDTPNNDASSSTSTPSSTNGTDHSHVFTDEVVAPLCVNKGYTLHKCACGYEYADDFTNPIGSHTFERGICTACEELDYAQIVNIVSTESIKANVSVTAVYQNKYYNIYTDVGMSNGSGVIFKYSNNEYYLLTNNHVVYNKELSAKSNTTRFYVTDYLGTQIQATLVENSALAEYDLAILKFSSTESYTILQLGNENPELGELVIALGQPEGQSNTITLGRVKDYGRVTITDADTTECNVSFDSLKHDAYINNGSSGGALLDASFRIIGVNFAGATDQDGKSLGSFAIPVEKIYEYFDKIGFQY